MRKTTLRRALTGAVVAILAGTVSVGHAMGSPQPNHDFDTVTGTVDDAEYLLGHGLLGLTPSVVDHLVADQAFAESVSADLRSGDPFAVDAALTAIAARTDAEAINADAAMVGDGALAVVTGYAIAVVISDRTEIEQMAGSGIFVTANAQHELYPASTTRPRTVDLINTGGLEREQAVSHIVETLGRT